MLALNMPPHTAWIAVIGCRLYAFRILPTIPQTLPHFWIPHFTFHIPQFRTRLSWYEYQRVWVICVCVWCVWLTSNMRLTSASSRRTLPVTKTVTMLFWMVPLLTLCDSPFPQMGVPNALTRIIFVKVMSLANIIRYQLKVQVTCVLFLISLWAEWCHHIAFCQIT